jgi:hypothetical protein
MKKLLSILVLFLSANLYADSMISIEQYVNDKGNNPKDPIVQTYVLKRCASAYLYTASITTRDKDMVDNLTKAYKKVAIRAAEILMQKLNWTEEVAGKSIKTDITNMLNFYEKDGNESFAKDGTYIMNNYIGNDVKFCKGIVESIK